MFFIFKTARSFSFFIPNIAELVVFLRACFKSFDLVNEQEITESDVRGPVLLAGCQSFGVWFDQIWRHPPESSAV
jgi:hypothetical protein